MRYIKYFENNSNVIQQPFLLVNDRLYVSDDIAKSITKWKANRKDKNIAYTELIIKRNHQFFNNERIENRYVTLYAQTDDFYVTYDRMYRMNIVIYRGAIRDNEFGHFQYYIGGNSGDHSMHGKNMIRATNKCNMSFMIKLYPIVEHIKDFYKKMKSDNTHRTTGFFDIIKEAIKKDNSIVQYGAPNELIEDNDVGYLIGAYKYNL